MLWLLVALVLLLVLTMALGGVGGITVFFAGALAVAAVVAFVLLLSRRTIKERPTEPLDEHPLSEMMDPERDDDQTG